jgi:hypothetical protein
MPPFHGCPKAQGTYYRPPGTFQVKSPCLTQKYRWLIAKNRVAEAEQILADLEGLDVNDAYVITESKDIQWAVQYEQENSVPWMDLLRGRTGQNGGTSTIRRLVLGMGTQAMQQFSGINVTSYYLPLVLINSVGFTNEMSRLLAACNSVSYLLFSLIGIPNVEKWGRRKMMMCKDSSPSLPPRGFFHLAEIPLQRPSSNT